MTSYWRRLGRGSEDTAASTRETSDETNDENARGPILHRQGSLKQQATHASIIDDITVRTRRATLSSSLNYQSGTWSNTLSSLRLCSDRGQQSNTTTAIVFRPWAALSCAALVLAILDMHYLDSHVLSIPSEVAVVLGGTMSLLLAFRLNSSYSRWWEGQPPCPRVARANPAQLAATCTPS